MSLVVYTAITGQYDRLRDPPEDIRGAEDWIGFMDSAHSPTFWQIRPLARRGDDPCRNAKAYKILSHEYFPDVQYSLWVDGSIEFVMPFAVRELIAYLHDADIAIFEHRLRHCLYQEACACIQQSLDDPELIYQQMFRYTRAGYPANAGLVEATVILRRHSPRVREFNNLWWEEIQNGSRRDQLSFNYVAWKTGIKYNLFPGRLDKNGLFRRHRHHYGSDTASM